jgi:hypothetical protein
MEETRYYERFPVGIVLLSNSVAVAIYGIGAYIFAGFGMLFCLLYVFYCLWVEIQVLRKSCVNCYYYGEVCGFGKGKICPLLFRRGDPQKFIEREISWLDLLPDFMVLIFPLAGGIILSITDFAWFRVTLLAALVMLSFGGNAVVRGSFACKFCKQREIGCPAEKLFNKAKTQKD